MKKKVIIVVVIILAILILGNGFGKRPFKDLTRDNIVNVSLSVTPPGKTIEIQDEFKIQSLVDTLNSVVIYKEDDTGREGDRQSVQFTLSINDGSIVKVEPSGTFMFINDKCYKTKIEPCLELYTLGNRLINYS
ncbi:hypothetical protein [Desulfitobacterium metallireducens]|uniref:Uncharacterized protein n=1 Tax=Desulfitobacterium metallireducens DSM 15288 TaxID=871968 RepID=W0E566_9FIRM|nr:hypothetical protein [Desulfitobacterium metallireducens]AHF06020.1 hypothetical protein DESME_02280 [Desulfitobacterium metallireducens DSM 15288]